MTPDPDRPPASRLAAVQGDITRQAVDAIVNAANSTLLGGGGVDGAIHRAAGIRLRLHCATLGGCATGAAKLTPGFNLPARWVIHTVGPVWRDGAHGEDDRLTDCYRHCLQLAQAQGVRTLAFPAISTGAYGFPLERATHIAVRTVRAVLAQQELPAQVLFVCFDPATLQCYQQALAAPAPAPA